MTTTDNPGSTAELLPCPFCGGEAQTDFIEDESFLIECYACRAETGIKDSPEEAVECWNRRAAQPAAPVVPEGWAKTLEQAATKLVTYSHIYTGDKQARRLAVELSAMRESFAASPQVEVAPQAEQVAPGDKSAPKDIWQACEWISQLRARVDSLLAIINASPERAAAPADLIAPAEAVVARWDSPKWKDEAPTAEYIAKLRSAIIATRTAEGADKRDAEGGAA